MDLTTIRRQIESGAIETFAQLNSAIVLMFANAIMFNSTDHDVNIAAKEMLHFALRHIYVCIYLFTCALSSKKSGGLNTKNVLRIEKERNQKE